jgi:hypothetical protein
MSTDDTIDAWENHVDGAVALTKLRGVDQFKTSMSRAVFRAVRTMMVSLYHFTSATSVLTSTDYELCPKSKAS